MVTMAMQLRQQRSEQQQQKRSNKKQISNVTKSNRKTKKKKKKDWSLNGGISSLLDSVYFNPVNPGSYGGEDRLLREANKLYLEMYKSNLPRHIIREYLSKQDAYTELKPARRRFSRNPYMIRGRGRQFGVDLMETSVLAESNDNVHFILILMDLFSRYVWVRPLQSKSAVSVLNALKDIFETSKVWPAKLQSDLGKEFFNKTLSRYLKSKKIHHFSIGKVPHVERFIRTLRTRLFRYNAKNNTTRFIDVLQDFIKSYNNSIHRSIGTSPYAVFVQGEPTGRRVRKIKQGEQFRRQRRLDEKNILKVGDYVRLSSDPVTGNIFEKEAYGRWTSEIFRIKNIIKNQRRLMYTVEGLQPRGNKNKKVTGSFYRDEVQKIAYTPPQKVTTTRKK